MFDDIKELTIDNNKVSVLKIGNDVVFPKDLQLYDYIESTGTQCIDTDILGKPNTIVELDLQPTIGFAGYTMIFGYAANATWNPFTLGTQQGVSGIFARWGQCTLTGNATFDDTRRILTLTSTMSTDTDGTLGLFTINGQPGNYQKQPMKLYTCIIKEGDVVVRCFIPCTYNGIAGMWETVENKFYGNSGTGSFLLGNRIVTFNQLINPNVVYRSYAGIYQTCTDDVIHLNGTITQTYFNLNGLAYNDNFMNKLGVGKYFVKVNILNNPDDIKLELGALNGKYVIKQKDSTTFTTSYSEIVEVTDATVNCAAGFGFSRITTGTVFNDVQIQISFIKLPDHTPVDDASVLTALNKIYKDDYYSFGEHTIITYD